MSAYMVDHRHIHYLIEASQSRRINPYGSLPLPLGPEAVGQMLWDANLESIHARYPDTIENPSATPGPINETYIYRHKSLLHLHNFDPVQVLKSCTCFEYQACEAETWGNSPAKKFIDALFQRAVMALPGYEEAIWGAPNG